MNTSVENLIQKQRRKEAHEKLAGLSFKWKKKFSSSENNDRLRVPFTIKTKGKTSGSKLSVKGIIKWHD